MSFFNKKPTNAEIAEYTARLQEAQTQRAITQEAFARAESRARRHILSTGLIATPPMNVVSDSLLSKELERQTGIVLEERESGIAIVPDAKISDSGFHIYNTLESAQDTLLKEAQSVLDAANAITNEEIDRIIRLRNLGFGQAKNITTRHKEIDAYSKAQELKNFITKYAEHYPLHKFVDVATVESLCKKYNLFMGAVRRFTGDIPERNQKAIVGFKVHSEDVRIMSDRRGGMRGSIEEDWFWGRTAAPILGPSGLASQPDVPVAPGPAQQLQICAPINEFDLSRSEIVDYRIMTDDPIVLQPVLGGFIVVTSWGHGAGDEALGHPLHN